MFANGKRVLAAAGVLSFAALFVGVGIRLSTADEPKTIYVSDLRDAVKAASKRGDNVDEIARALDAFEKAAAKGWKPEPGNTSPPNELLVLHQAVDAAGRKGENVEDIRKQLEAVEMKLLGRTLAKPRPEPPPLGDPKPEPRRGFPGDFPVRPRIEFPPFPQPEFPNRGFGGGIDREALQKAMDLRMQAMKALVNDPNDPKALELAQQATEMMLKAIGGRGGLLAPEMVFPELGGFGRVTDRFRLGVRMEKLTPIVVEQLGLEAGRGIAVAEVIANSPAEKAGFKAHDVILEFAGKPVSDTPEEFNKQVTAVKAGEKVDAVVLRKGKKVEIKGIELPEAKAELPDPIRRVPRPKLDINPRLLPQFPNTLPDLGPKPGVLPGGGDGIPNLNPLGRGNGNFAIQSDQNGVKYSLQGTIDNGEVKLSEIVIEVDGKAIKAESLDKVPEEHRATVEKLLKSAGGRNAKRVKD